MFQRSLAIGVLFGATVWAQEAPSVRSGTRELGLFAGASYGLDNFRPMGGVNLSYAVTKHILPYVEFSYFPELLRREESSTNLIEGGAKLVDLHFGVHVRFPVREKPVVPYLVAGGGWIRSDISGTNQTKPIPGLVTPAPLPFRFKDNDAAVNFGAGLRYYTTEVYGFRVEYKLYRPVSGRFQDLFQKFEGGLFFQF